MASGLRFITENPFTSAYDRRLQQQAEQERSDLEMGEFRRQRQIEDATDAAIRKGLGQGKSKLYDINQSVSQELMNIPGAGEKALGYATQAQEGREAEEEQYLKFALDNPDMADAWATQKGLQVPDPIRQMVRTRQGKEKLAWGFGILDEFYGGGAENAPLKAQAMQQLLAAPEGTDITGIIANLPRPRYTAPQGPIGYGPLEERPGLGWGQMDSRGQWHAAGGTGGGPGQTERIIAELMRRNPSLSYPEALAQAQRAPQDDNLRRETLAFNAAKGEAGFGPLDPERLDYWRKYYGATGQEAVPAAPQAVPDRSADIGQMEIEELVGLDVNQLTPAEQSALDQRLAELGY